MCTGDEGQGDGGKHEGMFGPKESWHLSEDGLVGGEALLLLLQLPPQALDLAVPIPHLHTMRPQACQVARVCRQSCFRQVGRRAPGTNPDRCHTD